MRAYITNHGENYENHLLLWIDGEMKAGLGAYVDPGKSDYVDFCTGAPAKGTHNLKITTDFAGNDIIFTDQLTITEAPEYQLTSENIIEGIGSDEKIHNALHIACKFTNTGTTTFDNMVYGQIGVVSCDDNGNVIYSNGVDGYPCFPWWRVEYLHLEPGESTVFEFTVGSEVMKMGNYKYSYSVDYYKNHHQTERVVGKGYYFFVEDGPSAITTVSRAATTDGVCYDLQGRRVGTETPAPGIYIRDGKKFMVK